MKTREVREPIPEDQIQDEVVRRFVGCDECEFEVEDFGDNNTVEAIEKHVAKEHCVAEKRMFAGEEYLRFEAGEKFNAYVKGRNAGSESREFWQGTWREPGWYREKFHREHANCRCGGCYNEYYDLLHVSVLVDQHMEDAQSHEAQAQDLAKEFGLPNPLEKT